MLSLAFALGCRKVGQIAVFRSLMPTLQPLYENTDGILDQTDLWPNSCLPVAKLVYYDYLY